MKRVFFVVALAIAAVACNNTSTESASEQTDSVAAQITQTTGSALFGTEWKLLELNGKGITVDTTFKKEPVVVFERGTGKLIGNGGCNSFMGSYKLKENRDIELSIKGATMMACPNLALETQFHDVLEQAKSYEITGNILLLNNAAKEVIAKLEASGK